jgi:hypothetical protein
MGEILEGEPNPETSMLEKPRLYSARRAIGVEITESMVAMGEA